eukprot:355717-Chlamydomonas_euryale.AAC.1
MGTDQARQRPADRADARARLWLARRCGSKADRLWPGKAPAKPGSVDVGGAAAHVAGSGAMPSVSGVVWGGGWLGVGCGGCRGLSACRDTQGWGWVRFVLWATVLPAGTATS